MRGGCYLAFLTLFITGYSAWSTNIQQAESSFDLIINSDPIISPLYEKISSTPSDNIRAFSYCSDGFVNNNVVSLDEGEVTLFYKMNVESLKILVEGKTNPILKTNIKVKQEYASTGPTIERDKSSSYLNYSSYFYTNSSTNEESSSKFFVKYYSSNTESSAQYINKNSYDNSYYSISNYSLTSNSDTKTYYYTCEASYNITNVNSLAGAGVDFYYFTTFKFNIGFNFNNPNPIIENLKYIRMDFTISYEVIE